MRDVTTAKLSDLSWFMGEVALDPRVTLIDPGIFQTIPVELSILRPDDLVVLQLRLHNLSITGPVANRRIAPVDSGKAAYLAVYHQPQSFAEQVYFDTSSTEGPSPLPAGSLLAGIKASGRSRVVHRFPTKLSDWDGSRSGLLSAMANWPLQHVPLALPDIGSDRTPFVTLTTLGETATVMMANPMLANMVGRAVRRAAQTMISLTPAAAQEAVVSIRSSVAKMASDAGMTKKVAQTAVQAAELQLAGSIGNKFVGLIDIGNIIGAIPGLRLLFKPRVPTTIETAIEIPYRLALSPLDDAVIFSHAISPVTLGTGRPRTELWHSRIGTLKGGVRQDATESPIAIAAIWTPDLIDPVFDPPFVTSLSKDGRIDLVYLTADETLRDGNARIYHPKPAWTDRLMLTALGGWLDLEGNWVTRPVKPDGNGIDLIKWSHHAALGRDYAVETVHIGNLAPFGHRASVLKITERRFEPHPNDGRVASLRQQFRIVVLEAVRGFPIAGQPANGRELPFTQIEILTEKTPKLVPPTDPSSFWARIQIGATPAQSEDFRFAVKATDLLGAEVRFDLPMRFVGESAPMSAAVADYNGSAQSIANRTAAEFGNQVVHLATGAGPVAFPIRTIRFAAYDVPTWSFGNTGPRVFPLVKAVSLVSTEVGQITGSEGIGEFSYDTPWINHGFGTGNEGEVYLSSTSQALDADLGGGAAIRTLQAAL
jgi:hypothetical protein